jgi:hypothetical protein
MYFFDLEKWEHVMSYKCVLDSSSFGYNSIFSVRLLKGIFTVALIL